MNALLPWIEGVVGGPVVASETLPAGTSTVLAARCDTATGPRDVIAKVYELDHWFATRDVVAREASAMDAAAAAVPTPQVIARTWDSSNDAFANGNGLLMERLPGGSRLEEADVLADIPAMVGALAAIHDLAPPEAPGSWPGPPPKFTEHLSPPPWTDRKREWATAFDVLRRELPGSDPVFLHGDFHPANVLFDQDGTVTGVVDWSAASLGAPEHDLANLRAAVALLAGVDAADRALSAYKALTGRDLPNQAWFDVCTAISVFCPEPSRNWEWLHPRLNAELLRPRLESFVLQCTRELTR